MRKLTAVISKTNTSVIFINQIRNKIGIIYGSPEVTTGGRALQFYASLRLDIRRTAGIAGGKEGDPFVGNRTRVKVVKNKFAPPFKQCEFDIVFGEGISKEGDVLDFAAAKGIIKRSGAWYAYEDEKIGQGREKAKQTLIDNPGLYEKIRKEVLEAE
jgi:recombination protein RecA